MLHSNFKNTRCLNFIYPAYDKIPYLSSNDFCISQLLFITILQYHEIKLKNEKMILLIRRSHKGSYYITFNMIH